MLTSTASQMCTFTDGLEEYLNDCVGKHISNFCGTGFVNDNAHHCAHFVSHILNLKMSPLCGGGQHGVCVSVQTLASHSPWFKEFNPQGQIPSSFCLVYVAPKASVNVTGKTIAGPKRHVGIYHAGRVWHYENNSNFERVVSYTLSGSDGVSKFAGRYGSTCGLWIGGIPYAGG